MYGGRLKRAELVREAAMSFHSSVWPASNAVATATRLWLLLLSPLASASGSRNSATVLINSSRRVTLPATSLGTCHARARDAPQSVALPTRRG